MIPTGPGPIPDLSEFIYLSVNKDGVKVHAIDGGRSNYPVYAQEKYMSRHGTSWIKTLVDAYPAELLNPRFESLEGAIYFYVDWVPPYAGDWDEIEVTTLVTQSSFDVSKIKQQVRPLCISAHLIPTAALPSDSTYNTSLSICSMATKCPLDPTLKSIPMRTYIGQEGGAELTLLPIEYITLKHSQFPVTATSLLPATAGEENWYESQFNSKSFLTTLIPPVRQGPPLLLDELTYDYVHGAIYSGPIGLKVEYLPDEPTWRRLTSNQPESLENSSFSLAVKLRYIGELIPLILSDGSADLRLGFAA